MEVHNVSIKMKFEEIKMLGGNARGFKNITLYFFKFSFICFGVNSANIIR